MENKYTPRRTRDYHASFIVHDVQALFVDACDKWKQVAINLQFSSAVLWQIHYVRETNEYTGVHRHAVQNLLKGINGWFAPLPYTCTDMSTCIPHSRAGKLLIIITPPQNLSSPSAVSLLGRG